jgi:hypothetical protein
MEAERTRKGQEIIHQTRWEQGSGPGEQGRTDPAHR